MNDVEDRPVSSVKNRDLVLALVIPKILGILGKIGRELKGFGSCCAQISEDIILSVTSLDAHRLMVSVYDGREPAIRKVLSFHVTSLPSAMDPNFYRYQKGHVAVLSWRRGKWEDAVMTESAGATVSIEHALRGMVQKLRK